MSSTRIPKIEDFLKKEISQIISSQAKDPRYKFLNIVDVKCSSDLGVAKVFYTIINGNISAVSYTHLTLPTTPYV